METPPASRGVGFGSKRRPKREELLKAARRRELAALVVWKLDRWGRSLADLIASLAELRDLGIAFVSLIFIRTSQLISTVMIEGQDTLSASRLFYTMYVPDARTSRGTWVLTRQGENGNEKQNHES